MLLGYLDGSMPYYDAYSLCNELQNQIDEKFEAMEKRETFTKYKVAPVGSGERETFRKQYLNLYINKKWHSNTEDFTI